MSVINSLIVNQMKRRYSRIEHFMKHPYSVQQKVLLQLLAKAKNTEFGKKHNFSSIKSPDEFRLKVPLNTYENIYPYIDRLIKGEQNLLWPGKLNWFAKSSGTTNSKSKFIPVSNETLYRCHYKGGKDVLSVYCAQHKNTKIFKGKSFVMGGSQEINELNENSKIGDLSAILIENLPTWVKVRKSPSNEIAIIANWEEKLNRMASYAINDNLTSISGTPFWTLLLFNKVLQKTGKKNIEEVWPNLEMFMHGGVSFEPYVEQYAALFPSGKLNRIETYNASEGFFGIQNNKEEKDLLLMLDLGIYYEFIPLHEINNPQPKTLLLHELQVNKTYALVLSTNSGLWRYILGDTIKITSVNPFRFVIVGRTKSFINTFGEELMIDNTEKAIGKVCKDLKLKVNDYTVAPLVLQNKSCGKHEWIIEFETPPSNLILFTEMLDSALKSLNSDYEIKRTNNIVLQMPEVIVVKSGTFYDWLKSKGKLGGQNKTPRLSNDRIIIEEIKKFIR